MDVISRVLEKISLSSSVYFNSDFASPWGMDIPAGSYAQFHMVIKGQCSLVARNVKLLLKAGDIVIFPHGTAHWLADKATSKKTNGKEAVAAILAGNSLFEGDDVATSLICGHFEFDRELDHPFIQQLPELMRISDQDLSRLPWLKSIADLIIAETQNKHAGSALLQKKLGEILFIHAIRAHMLKQEQKIGFLAALQDQKIARAIQAIHDKPGEHWQLAKLASIAGMSRTSFSNHFKSLTGETALSYITNWRITEAKSLLQQSDKPVGEIAETVGYRSEAAFNRIFKKKVAITPLKYRKSIAGS